MLSTLHTWPGGWRMESNYLRVRYIFGYHFSGRVIGMVFLVFVRPVKKKSDPETPKFSWLRASRRNEVFFMPYAPQH